MAGAIIDTFNGSVVLGDNVSVNYYTILYGHGGLSIGANTRIAANTVIIPANHVFSDPAVPICEQGETRQGIKIGNDVWLAAGVTVLDGCHVADGCVIGARSTVIADTEAYSLYVGTPARKVKNRAQ